MISAQSEAIQRLEGCSCMPVVTIRVNPDAYDGRRVRRQERADTVAELLRYYLEESLPRGAQFPKRRVRAPSCSTYWPLPA